MAIENRLVLIIIQPFENNMTGTIKLKEKDETPLKNMIPIIKKCQINCMIPAS